MSEAEAGQVAKGKERTFNKKKWREQKYSVKAKVKRWDDNRKRNLIRKYQKELNRSSGEANGKERENRGVNGKASPLKRAALEFERIREEKKKKREEVERANAERKEALKAYKEKKAARFKKLSQRNSKGQPLMKGRMELLLEKIQKNYADHKS